MWRLAAAISLVPTMTLAQATCGSADEVIDYLSTQHREAPVATMMMGPDRMIIFAREDGTSWTLVIQRGGQLCLVAEGQSYQPIKWREHGRKS